MVAPTLHAQFAIPTYTIDSGGGTSSGGSFSLTGTIGQADASDASSGGAFAVSGGFWAANTNPYSGSYQAWAAANLPAGADHSFDGDADLDGVSNGVAYIFGADGVELIGEGVLTAPPVILPGDVDLVLESSTDLLAWDPVLEFTSGIQTMLDPDFSIAGGEITDTSAGVRTFYRYRATLLQ